jgi:hypothetical protein
MRGFSIFDFRFSIAALSAVALCAGGCVTRPKVYKAPDASKVIATSKRLSAAIDRENETRARAETKVQEAQASEDRVAEHSASVLQLIRELEPFIPAEQKPKFNELKTSADAQIAEEGNLSTALAGVRGEITQLKADQAAVVKERDQLVKVDQPKLFADGKQLAQSATDERNARIVAEKQLVQQKIFRILWTVGGSVAVLLIVVIIVLAMLGKLGVVLAKVGIKAAV